MFLWVVPYFDEPVGQQIKCQKSVAILHQQTLMCTCCQDCWQMKLALESTCNALCKWALCMRQIFVFNKFSTYRHNTKKCLGKEWWCVLFLDKSTDHVTPHFGLFFTTISTSKKMFFSERKLKKALCDTLTQTVV